MATLRYVFPVLTLHRGVTGAEADALAAADPMRAKPRAVAMLIVRVGDFMALLQCAVARESPALGNLDSAIAVVSKTQKLPHGILR
jgi:predicted membrane-bound dolichyl-phosphate-mannose-protein mannosyltransferase